MGIVAAGIVEQDSDRDYFEIEEPISFKDEVTGTELLALPGDKFEITAMIDFNSHILGHQYASLQNIEEYETQIAPCRTLFLSVNWNNYLIKTSSKEVTSIMQS
jgi:UDP-3-O-[3-hydroxymyristoyl] N-acetylglucosamine deacetylase/3-hydroxyacyl-[acyl-carrier-protein] dehydratase